MTWQNFKRPFDLVVATLLLVVLSPLLLAIAVCVRVALGRSVLFVQERPGLNARTFKIYKFRTMRDLRDSEGKLLPDEERLTGFGRFLRATSLDELPELWNVVRGDMSLVGPRPLLPEYIPLYDERQSRRHLVRPGITGVAQVNGRNLLTWEERLELDVWYVENCSILLDLKTLWLTVFRVTSARGVLPENGATMPKFTGSKKERDRTDLPTA
jgi:lipopolysaccharide/colanic/teichoic acid biosynthesis glycosyltransferase